MTTKTKSTTIRGIIIAVFGMLIGLIARQVDSPITEGETVELLTQIADIAGSWVSLTLEAVGLFMAYRGRMNPKIEPLK